MSAQPKTKDSLPGESLNEGNKPIYHVTKLEKCKLNQGGPSGYRYIIEGGYAPITGFRAGTKEHVHTHAASLAKEMNNRRGMKGTKHIVIGKPKTS